MAFMPTAPPTFVKSNSADQRGLRSKSSRAPLLSGGSLVRVARRENAARNPAFARFLRERISEPRIDEAAGHHPPLPPMLGWSYWRSRCPRRLRHLIFGAPLAANC